MTVEGLGLLVAHLLGDYVLQDDYMAANKKKSSLVCLWHCVTYTLAVWLCTVAWMPWWGLLLCCALHYPIDRYNVIGPYMRAMNQGVFLDKLGPWSAIVVDNVYHLACLYAIGLLALYGASWPSITFVFAFVGVACALAFTYYSNNNWPAWTLAPSPGAEVELTQLNGTKVRLRLITGDAADPLRGLEASHLRMEVWLRSAADVEWFAGVRGVVEECVAGSKSADAVTLVLHLSGKATRTSLAVVKRTTDCAFVMDLQPPNTRVALPYVPGESESDFGARTQQILFVMLQTGKITHGEFEAVINRAHERFNATKGGTVLDGVDRCQHSMEI